MRSLRFIWWKNKSKIGPVIVQTVTVPVLAVLTPFSLVWLLAYKLFLKAKSAQSAGLK